MHFFTDRATATLQYSGDDDVITDGDVLTDEDFDPSKADTVTRDGPWVDFFDTDEFVEFEATVAQPIVQPYFYDGELRRFKKEKSELKQAQAQIDNTPWTMDHPPRNRVTNADQIRGVWKNPYWSDGQKATLHIPANDPEAVRYAVHNDDVSIGFRGNLDWTDSDDTSHDAVQRDMVYDHIASVENGRCSPEEGCGLHTDSPSVGATDEPHGHVHTDSVRTTSSEESMTTSEMNPKFSEGDWVSWEWGEGTATGRITTVSTDQPLSVSGTERDPTEEGEPVYKAKHWDDGEWGNFKVAYESNLSEASQPENFTDATVHSACHALCSPGTCSCGLHDPFADVEVDGTDINLVPPEAAQNAAQQALDARADDDVTVNGMTDHGWSRAEQLASGEELSPSDIVGSSGAMAPWWSRHAQYSIEGGDTLSLAGADADNPWKDNSYTAGKGWGGVAGYKWAIRKGNEIKRARGEEPTYDVVDASISIPDFESGDLVRHRYIDDLRGYVAHNPEEKSYVMVDPIVDGERNNHTMTFGTADIELVSKMGGPSPRRTALLADATIMGTISYDGLMGGKLDQSEIPNDDYEDHYVFPADTKSDSAYPLVDADGNLRRGNVKSAWELYGKAPDEELLLDVLAQANDQFIEADGYSAPIPEKSLDEAMSASLGDNTDDSQTTNMSENLQEFIDENDLTFEDVVDALDIELEAIDGVPNEPHDFYDGEPTVEDLKDDFDAVGVLVDEKESLHETVDELREEVREAKRPVFADKAERLAEMTDRWGDSDDIMEKFDAEDEDERWTVDDIDAKIELVEDIKETETTTVADSTDDGDGQSHDLDTTDSGRFDLRDNTKVGN